MTALCLDCCVLAPAVIACDGDVVLDLDDENGPSVNRKTLEKVFLIIIFSWPPNLGNNYLLPPSSLSWICFLANPPKAPFIDSRVRS